MYLRPKSRIEHRNNFYYMSSLSKNEGKYFHTRYFFLETGPSQLKRNGYNLQGRKLCQTCFPLFFFHYRSILKRKESVPSCFQRVAFFRSCLLYKETNGKSQNMFPQQNGRKSTKCIDASQVRHFQSAAMHLTELNILISINESKHDERFITFHSHIFCKTISVIFSLYYVQTI